MKRFSLLFPAALAACLIVGTAGAQPMGGPPPDAGGPGGGLGGPPGGGRPAFLDQLFLPATVMRNQEAIHLTDDQRQAIQQAMVQTQGKLVELQWKLEAQQEKLTSLLSTPSVDESRALAQVDQVMALEQQVKKLNLELLIQIKNRLTPAQQDELRKLKPARPGGPPWMRGD